MAIFPQGGQSTAPLARSWSRRGTSSIIMECPEINFVPPGASHTPKHTPPCHCAGLYLNRPCASRRDTPHERAGARDEHQSPVMPTALTSHARGGARGRVRGGLLFSGRRRCRVVGEAPGYSSKYLNCHDPPKSRSAPEQLDQNDLERSREALLRTCLAAVCRADTAERDLGTCEHFPGLSSTGTTLRCALNHRPLGGGSGR